MESSIRSFPQLAAAVQIRNLPTLFERVEALEKANFNLGCLPKNQVYIDLETDGGASAWSMEQLSAIFSGITGKGEDTELESLFLDVFGYRYMVPCVHGRAAESIWCQATVKMGTLVLANMLFPTSLFHHFQNMCRVYESIIPEAYNFFSDFPFKGNLDLERMHQILSDFPNRVTYVWVEPCCNAAGGHPVSMKNLKEIRKFADMHGIQVIINATRILENSYLIQQREAGYHDHSILEIVHEFCSLSDSCIMSAAKDFLVDHGGFVATNDEETYLQVKGLCYMKGVHVSSIERSLMLQGLREAIKPNWISSRVKQVEYLHSRLRKYGLPVLEPYGGNAVYLDTTRFLPHIPLNQHPSEALSTYIYRFSGIRVRPGFLTLAQRAKGVRLLRLAVPPRRYNLEDLDYIVDALTAVWEKREKIQGLCPTNSVAGMAPLQGKSAHFKIAKQGEWTAMNWAQIWWERARVMSKRIMVVTEQADGHFKQITWGDLAAQAKLAVQGLLAIGLKQGDKLAFLCENCTEWLAMDAACLATGVVTVPIYPPTHAARARKLLAVSEANVVFVSNRKQLEKITPGRDELTFLKQIVIVDDSDCPEDQRLISWKDLLALGEKKPITDEDWQKQIASIPIDAIATIMYTSGTTGLPSGSLLTHANLVASQYCSGTTWPFFEDKNYFIPVLLDLNHILGRNFFYAAVSCGYVTVVLPRKIDTDFDPTIFEIFPPATMIVVPRIIDKLVNYLLQDAQISKSLQIIDDFEMSACPSEKMDIYKDARRKLAMRVRIRMGGRIMFIIHAGAPLSPTHQRFFKLCGIILAEGYGMTECGIISSNSVYDIIREDTVGLTHPYIQVKSGENDEIMVKGPIVFPGYANDPERTSSSFDADEWFHTGDQGTFDEDGYLKLTGRIKDTYNLSDGSNIYPSWIENLIVSSHLVDQAVLIGDLRSYVTALIVPDYEAVARRLNELGEPIPATAIDPTDSKVRRIFEEMIEKSNIYLAPAEQIRCFTLLAKPFPDECVAEIPSRIKVQVNRANVYKKYKSDIEAMYE